MYHSLGTKVKNDIYGIYSLDKDIFRSQMHYLKKNLSECITSMENFASIDQSVTITFDDGFADVFYNAVPILSELNIPFTIFIAPKLVIEKNEYLSISELKELAQLDNCIIGSHGYSHRPLTNLNLLNIKNEIYYSKLWLEDTVGKEIKFMSYPHGMVNSTIKNEVKKAGFVYACSSRPGVNRMKFDFFDLQRTSILSHDDMEQFIIKINGGWDWTRWI